MHYWNKIAGGCLVAGMFVLLGCGGGGSSTPAQPTISGTASQGAALAAGSTVFLKDAKGVEKTATIVGDSGSFTFAVDGLTAPFVLKAGNMYSFSTKTGTVNINPFTQLCMVNTLGTTDMAAVYGDAAKAPAAESLNTLATKYQAFVDDLKAKIDALYSSSVPASQRDFLNGAIVIGQGVDKIFENIDITSSASGFTIKSKGQADILLSGTRDQTSGAVTLTRDDSVIATLNNILFEIHKISITSTGSGTYSIQADNLNGVAAIDLTISYDSSSLSSPTVTDGALISGALLVPNTLNPGQIRIAIIRATPFSGGGEIAKISFAAKTGTGGITALTASITDIAGKPLIVQTSI